MTKTEPPLLALYENAEGALALAVGGRVAWRCPAGTLAQPALAAPGKPTPCAATPPAPRLRLVVPNQPAAAPQGPWRLLSDNQDTIHAVLVRTGIFDQLVSALGAQMEKRSGRSHRMWFKRFMAGRPDAYLP